MAIRSLEPAPVNQAIAQNVSFVGTVWEKWFPKLTAILNSIIPSVSPNRGDSDVTLYVGKDAHTQIFSTTLSIPRTITLSTDKAYNGAWFEIVRTASSENGLDVGGLITLNANHWCKVSMTDTVWILVAYGSLV